MTQFKIPDWTVDELTAIGEKGESWDDWDGGRDAHGDWTEQG